MTSTPYHNLESFERAIDNMIAQADDAGRGDDLDRLIVYMENKPKQVSSLGSFMMMLDEDWRLNLRDEIEALRRWGTQKGKEISDDGVLKLMLNVYAKRRKKGK